MGILKRLLGTDPSSLPQADDVLARTADGVVLRRLRPETDLEAVCGFQEDVYTTNFPDFRVSRHFLQGFEYDLRRAAASRDHGVFVLDDGGMLVGFLWVVVHESAWSGKRQGYVNNLYVLPAWRGRGLGRLLIEFTDQFLAEQDVATSRLTVTVDNEVAVRLYRNAGYNVERYEMTKTVSEAPSHGRRQHEQQSAPDRPCP